MQFIKSFQHWVITHKKLSIPAVVIIVIIILIFRPKPAPAIVTTVIQPTTLTQIVSVSGTVNAKKSVNLTFPIGGTISWIGVQKGDTVKQWQTIATLDERTAQKNLQAALIAYSLQRNAFDQKIADNNGISSPTNALNDNMKRILQDNQYNLDQAVNSVELQDLARQQSILTTPIAGIVTRADAVASGVTATATTIFTVTDPSSVVFAMDVDEADVSKVKIGQIAQITLDAYANTVYKLPVTSIDFVSHTTSSGGNAYTVEAKLPQNVQDKFRVGMNGNADIITAQKQNVLSVPLSALNDDQTVYVKRGNKYVKTKVTLGLQTDTDAQVLSGLKQGDIVALDPAAVEKDKLVTTQ